MIDIVVATCERLPLLKRTLHSIWGNTKAPHRLLVIDDASLGGNAAYLRNLEREGLVDGLLLRQKRTGIVANLRVLHDMTVSPLIIYCDDDQLCPDLEPDWLSRLVDEISRRPKQGILSLNNPHGNAGGDKRRKLGTDGAVTFCKRSGGSYMCIRRSLLPEIMPDHGERSPVSAMCVKARALGWENGYLTEVYCQHIGRMSVRNGKNLSREIDLVMPVDKKTLEPARQYRG